MIRTLIKLGLLLLAGILIYNYFFGTSEEKQQSKEVFKKTGDALGAAWDLLKAEKQKFDTGKYDKVLDQLGSAYRAVRQRAQYVDEKVLQRLDQLEQRKIVLERQLDSIETQDAAPPPPPAKKGSKAAAQAEKARQAEAAEQQRRKKDLQRELDELLNDSKELLRQAQEN